jgi:hypothetical protein
MNVASLLAWASDREPVGISVLNGVNASGNRNRKENESKFLHADAPCRTKESQSRSSQIGTQLVIVSAVRVRKGSGAGITARNIFNNRPARPRSRALLVFGI